MDTFQHKTLVTKPYDLTYSYYLSANFHNRDPSIPVLIFSHGYPDNAQMWSGALPHMLKSPYPIILMDILGLGHSSKPTEPKMYNYKQQADSIAQILDHEGVGKEKTVIPIGHDWGSGVSQRFYLWHRERCLGLALLSLAYLIPNPDPIDLDDLNKATARRFGYPQWEYWNFFTAPDAAQLMEADLLRFWEVNNGNYPSNIPGEKGRDIWMREMFCTLGAMREYVAKQGKYKDFTVDLKPYAKDPKLQKDFVERMKRDGFAAPVCYYHSLRDNTMLEEERHLSRSKESMTIDVPMLYIGQTGDWVCRTDLMGDAKDQGLVTDLEEKVVDAGHWVLYEKPQEIAEIISEWVNRKFPVKK
ncbi:Alpha/Beta hydrolase protein [Neohortaea acidophila]|uniref:Alpha/Beta hydrolase protein n=1 Tax=Neohortaea acidophila TaxID=245834 RepID=A0A6A6PKC6_9PEZI|nr:Alpha/Beta hydrolase protein [Neohortaea acidophila]KAF2480510.1 Alpha/Beta hydrolase protein [Neohortaea acidophila]